MNTQEIITAIGQQSKKLESLEEHILRDCRYYQSRIKELDNKEPNHELILLLGAFLATYQLWQISQPETYHHRAVINGAITFPDFLESAIYTYFSPAE